jgi:hypothetical protein
MLVAYALEILPYAIRAKGFAYMVCYNPRRSCAVISDSPSPKNMAVSAALAFNQFVSPLALNALGWKYVSLCPFALSPELPDLIDLVSRVLWVVGLRVDLRYPIRGGDTRKNPRRNRSALRW